MALPPRRWMLLLVFLLGANPVVAQEGKADAFDEVAPGATHVEYRLLLQGNFLPKGGYQVQWVNPTGPGAWMRDAQGRRGILEAGDVITAIDGRRVLQPADYYTALNASAPQGGNVQITVRDTRTGREALWNVRAVQVRVLGPPISPKSPSQVKILLVGLTDDPSLGKMIPVSLARLRDVFNGIPGLRGQDIIELRGNQVTADNILRTVDRIQVNNNETLLCYYIGHGAYDPNRAKGDPSGGHFFQIPSGDLMRSALLNKLKSRGARLTVLISDTCNVRSIAQPPPVYEYRQPFAGQNRVLQNLLLQHAGVLDVSGSSRDQYGWFSLNPGGWFSEAFAASTDPTLYRNLPFVSWDAFLQQVSQSVSQEFQRRRAALLKNPGSTPGEVLNQIRGQNDQRPQVFTRDLRVIR